MNEELKNRFRTALRCAWMAGWMADSQIRIESDVDAIYAKILLPANGER